MDRALIASAIVYTNSQMRRIQKKTLSDSSSKKIGFDESRAGGWIHWFNVDERPICVKQYAVSNISRFMWIGHLWEGYCRTTSSQGFCLSFSHQSSFFAALISLLVLNFQLILFFPSAVKFYPGLLKHCVFEPGNYFQLLGKRFLRVFIYLPRHCFDLSDYVSINAGCTCLSLRYLINR